MVEGAVLDLTGDAPVVVVGELVETAVEEPPVVEKPLRIKKEKPIREKVEKPKQEKVENPEQKEKIIKRMDLTQEDMQAIVDSMKQTCNRCGNEDYYPLRKWSDEKVCPTCYDIAFREHCVVFNEWLRSMGIKGCAFCGKVRDNPSGFHFDHVNMFDKDSSVGNLLFEGANMDVIKAEIHKCQLLCIGCHAIVTKMENRLGFTYLKRKKRRETNVTREDYMPVMTGVYEFIKKLRGRGGGEDVK